ncbi:aminotransferase class III-fold pyridoxal phosphate-dependent enzyme, partial [Paenarthrobacter sp.]|uniref:aminotransferase class III-fold pyridoxal phosphate-dependent enzyme n=1 Tax=Paenarthrobacter sp. TaxID=1931993 RepID=UPI002811FB70
MTAQITVGGPELTQERRIITEIPGPRSREILERKASAVARSVGHTLPIIADAAGGGTLVDVDGNSFIDLGSGIAVTSVGNSNPRVVNAVREQLDRFTHTAFTVVPYESYIAVAEKLNEITPGDFTKRTALFNSGSEAVENAVKVARRATGRQAIVAFEHSFHGRTNLAMALTAKSAPYKQG